ncbi:MAG: kynurenine formamidase [Hyphococcus sp.]|nr:MAG: kynurenine formamidase [Marinicaulis sp.]
MSIIDITPALSSTSLAFPGDTVFKAEPVMEIGEDCPVNVSRLTLSSHAGAHADAPLHYHREGTPIHAIDLDPYIGPCTVVHMINHDEVITLSVLEKTLAASGEALAPRILIRTYENQPDTWDPAFTAVSADAITWLASNGVKLIGVDTPSLDPATSKTMDAHNAIYQNNMRILEGLKLDNVAAGTYELIALPLKLEGLDAAPVRAILRTLP